MASRATKTLSISLAIIAVAVVVIIGWRAIVPAPDPGPELQTLCSYMRIAAGAACTVAVAPDAFPVGNVVVLPDSPNQNAPLPLTHRDFASVCWIEPKDQEQINRLLARPPADMSLPGFSADVSRKLKAGATISLAEADNLKIIAGSNSDLVKTISVALREAHVLQLDQGQIENLLHRPEVREDCFSRLLGPRTRLIVSLIYANGIDYSVTLTDDHHIDLDAAVKSGYINVDAGPQATSGGKIATSLSATAPRVMGAVFADELMVEDLKKLVVRGNAITASSSNRVGIVSDSSNNPTGAKDEVGRQNSDGSLVLDSNAFRNIWENQTKKQLATNGDSSVEVQQPLVSGSATTSQTSKPSFTINPLASITLNTNVRITPGHLTVFSVIHSPFTSNQKNKRIVTFLGVAPVALTQKVLGEFQVFKRLDGPEVLTIKVNRDAKDTGPVNTNLPLTVRITDGENHVIGPVSIIEPQRIGPDGNVIKINLDSAGIYHVLASQEGVIPADNGLTVQSNIVIVASIGQDTPEPVRHGSL